MKRLVAIVLLAAVISGATGSIVAVLLDQDAAARSATSLSTEDATASPARGRAGLTPEQIYKQDAPGVVVITDTQTETQAATPFSPPSPQKVEALGSGFVIDSRGDILTNDHVVQGATNIRVGFSNGVSYPATVVGTDPSTDVAVVRVDAPASALHPLEFAKSSELQVGDPVYAIGNPFGLDRTMTAGIVSAVDRDIQAPNGMTIPNAIQTDAAVNHGNSGGPLLDSLGRVVGINSQIEGGTVDANVGVAFAVPSDTAKSIAQQLIAKGRVEHAWLGVRVATIEPGMSQAVRGLPSSGVIVTGVVKGGPAASAGLKPASRVETVNGVSVPVGGDVIVAVDGKPVQTAAQLGAAVARHKPGDTISLVVVRNGKRTVEVTLGDVPNVS